MIKKQICKTSLALLSFMLFALPVKAADDSVALQVNGNKVEATFQSGTASGAQEEILSLQLSFKLTSKEGKPKKSEVAFEFNSAIQSVVAESRYQESTGVLSIYISGSGNILSGDETSLGKVIFTPSAETAQYSVKVVENSLKTVNKAFYMEELPVIAPIEGNVVIEGNSGGGNGGNGGSGNGGNGSSGGNGGSGSGSNGSGSGNHDYDNWYSDEEDSRRPENTITSSRPPEIFVTNQNPAPVVNPNTTPSLEVPSNSETTPANQQVNNTPDYGSSSAPAENTTGTQNQPSSFGTGNGNNKGNNSLNSDKKENGEGNTETGAASEDSNGFISEPEESETVSEVQSQEEKDTEVTAQPEKTQENEEKKSSKALIWVLVILGMVVAAAAVATALVLMRHSPERNKENTKKDTLD